MEPSEQSYPKSKPFVTVCLSQDGQVECGTSNAQGLGPDLVLGLYTSLLTVMLIPRE